jgi:2-iminobutanoate/2-iminopropanoate deaminase
MANKAIHTENAPAALCPYSQAIQACNTIYVSGQLGLDPATGKFAGDDAVSQARQSLTNISNILKAAGATMRDVVTVTVLLDDVSAFAEVNKVYAEFFAEPYPARACYEVSKLPADALIEIQVTAVLSEKAEQ